MFAVVRIGSEPGRHHGGERTDDDGHDDAGEPRGLLDTEQVHGGEGNDRADPERPGTVRVGVGTEGEGHRRATGGLADDEPPPGEKPPQVAETLAAVDVRATRRGVERGELRGGRRIAVRHHRRQGQADQQPAAGHGRGRSDRREHPRTDHRTEADHHRVERAEPTRQPGRRGRAISDRRAAVISRREPRRTMMPLAPARAADPPARSGGALGKRARRRRR